MNSGCLLDTNIISAVFKRDRRVMQRLSEVDFFLSPIVVGELYQGAFSSPNRAALLDDIRTLVRTVSLLKFNAITSERFGIIAADLVQRGSPIPDNDIWIAAQALQHNLILVSRDAHFSRVQGLQFEQW